MLGILEQHEAICPECGSPYHLDVTFTGTCRFTPDGTDDNGSHEYEDSSPCSCADCGWLGLLKDAREAFESLPDVVGVAMVADRKVRFSKEAVARFLARWPAHGMSEGRAYWFEFDSSGDLVCTDVPEHSDGAAASALADDAKAWLRERKTPEWA